MTWRLSSGVLIQEGVDTDLSGIATQAPNAVDSTTTSNTGVRTTTLVNTVQVRITGMLYHNMERDRLIIPLSATSGNALGLEIRGGTYWTAQPRGVTRTQPNSETFADPNAGTTLPATGTDGELFLRTNDATVHRWSGTAWTQLTPQQLTQVPWTAGTGVEFTGEWTWFGGSFSDSSALRYAFAATQGGTWGAHGGRWLGKTSYFGSGTSTFNPPNIQCYGNFAYVVQELSTTNDGTRSDDPNRAPITRFYTGDTSGILGNFDWQGGNFSISTPANRTPPTFTINRSAGGYGYGFQQFNVFNPASTTRTYPTIRNVSVSNNIVDAAVYWRVVADTTGQRLQNVLETTDQINVNGLEVDGGNFQQNDNAGYTFMTRQIETGIARAPNLISNVATTQGVIYATDVNNNNRRLSSNVTAIDDSDDYVYTFEFNNTITDYTVTSGATSGAGRAMAIADENEICIAINSVQKINNNSDNTGLIPRSFPDTGVWRLDRRVATGDTIPLDIWSYENAYERRNVSLTGFTGVLTLGGVLATDPYVSRSRAAVIGRRTALEAAGFAYSGVAYTTANVGMTLSDIYDIVKYNKETRADQRNVPNVTSLPLSTDGRTLDIGARALVYNADVADWASSASPLAQAPFNRIRTTGSATIGGSVEGHTVEANQINIPLNVNQPIYRDGGFDTGLPVNLRPTTTLTNWNFDCPTVGNWNTNHTVSGVTLGRNAVTFALSGVATTVSSGDLLGGVTVASGQTLTLTSTTPVAVNFPTGTTITNNSASLGAGTVMGSANVTLTALQVVAPNRRPTPALARFDGLYAGADWAIYDVTNGITQGATPLLTSTANAAAVVNGSIALRGTLDTQLDAALTDMQVSTTFPGTEVSGLGSTVTRLLLINGNRAYLTAAHGVYVPAATVTYNIVANAQENGMAVPVGLSAPVTVNSTLMSFNIDQNVVTTQTGQTNVAITRGDFTIDGTTYQNNARFSISGYSPAVDGQNKSKVNVTNAIFASARDNSNWISFVFDRINTQGETTANQQRIIPSFGTFTTPIRYQWEPFRLASDGVFIRRTHGFLDGGDTHEVCEGIYLAFDNNTASILTASPTELGEGFNNLDVASQSVSRDQGTLDSDGNPTVESIPISGGITSNDIQTLLGVDPNDAAAFPNVVDAVLTRAED